MRRPSHIPARQFCPLATAAAVALAAMVLALPAKAADPRLSAEWNRLAVALFTPLNAPDLGDHAAIPGAPETPAAQVPAVPWFGAAPRLSLVARDWAESRRLLGDLALTDELRTTRSSRMVISRLRLADGLVSPFAQVGVGEWRVDTTLLPSLPHERMLAGQAGLGFELTLAHDTVVAVEGDWTLLRPSDASDVLAQTHPALWGTYVAMRTRF
jgi:hypothetical protein